MKLLQKLDWLAFLFIWTVGIIIIAYGVGKLLNHAIQGIQWLK